MKFSTAVVLATFTSVSAFTPKPAFRVSTTALNAEQPIDWSTYGAAPAAAAPVAAAPAADAPIDWSTYGAAPAAAAPAPAAAAPVAAAPAADAPIDWSTFGAAPAAAAPAAAAPVAAAPAADAPIDWSTFGAAPAAAAPAAAAPVAAAPAADAPIDWSTFGAAPAAAAPAPVAAAPAPAAPAAPAAAAEGGFTYGEYDEVMWDNAAKIDVYNKWNPSSPRSTRNFNPFETWEGNSPDASGIYPGENRYKDPIRPDISYAIMLEEKAEAEERAASPKAGSEPGCAGCRN